MLNLIQEGLRFEAGRREWKQQLLQALPPRSMIGDKTRNGTNIAQHLEIHSLSCVWIGRFCFMSLFLKWLSDAKGISKANTSPTTTGRIDFTKHRKVQVSRFRGTSRYHNSFCLWPTSPFTYHFHIIRPCLKQIISDSFGKSLSKQTWEYLFDLSQLRRHKLLSWNAVLQPNTFHVLEMI